MVTLLRVFLIVASVVFCKNAPLAVAGDLDTPATRRVYYNLDCSEFFLGTFGPVVPETIDRFVDSLAALGITDLMINVNAQRTNYRSDVWESYWDGYDPEAGNEQPFFAGLDPKRPWDSAFYVNTYRLHEQGCDYPRRMIDRARRREIEAWISLRMNDDHDPHRPESPIHSTFWRSHPQWRLPYGLDYEQPEVRAHYMNLIREVCTRYDLDGLELDFLRFWLYFRPGREHEGAKLMTDFVAEAREVTGQAAKRLGHPVKLAVRVPTRPWIARRHGLDAVAWAKAGLVDLIVATPWFSSIDGDAPLETWKGLLRDTGTTLALSLDTGIDSGASGRQPMTHEEMRGVYLSALHRGADAVYFFNMFCSPYQSWPREDYEQLLKDASAYSDLRDGPRRHAVTIVSPWAIGEPGSDRPLPYTGTHGVFRLHIGPKPLPRQQSRIELVVDNQNVTPEVRLNGIPCPFSCVAEPEHITSSRTGRDKTARDRHIYTVPPDALSEGYNLIEVNSDQDATLTWVEIAVHY